MKFLNRLKSKLLEKSSGIIRVRRFNHSNYGYSKEFRNWLKQNPRTLKKVSVLLNKALKKRTVRDKNIEITRLSTKKYGGSSHEHLFLVCLNGIKFFVKKAKHPIPADMASAYNQVEKYFKQRNMKAGKYNIRILHPHFFIENYIASDFFPKAIPQKVSNLPRKKKIDIEANLEPDQKKLEKREIFDIDASNMFLEEKTNTLFIFDISSKEELKQRITSETFYRVIQSLKNS